MGTENLKDPDSLSGKRVDHDGDEVEGWLAPGLNLELTKRRRRASSQLFVLYGKILPFYLIIITIKLDGIFCHNKKNICSSFFDGTRVCF
jgi:hypothetical protein